MGCARLRSPVRPHIRNSRAQKPHKENGGCGVRLRTKQAMHGYSSSESPVSTRGLDVWRCSALETALQQVEKSLGATGRSRGERCKGVPADAAASGRRQGTQSAKGTMSHILQQMRQGSAQRSLKKKQQGVGGSQHYSKERGQCQKRCASRERGVTHSGRMLATEQRCLHRSSSAIGGRGKGVGPVRAAFPGQRNERAACCLLYTSPSPRD